ncbi:MAG: SAM-dependent DNA methyltransferase [Methanobacteriota archaeon]|nr:MAG: SAM-dependent DNA methyltransferase [Euryarchaeota archaeon]
MPDIKQLEQTRLKLQKQLDAAKTQAERNQLGQFSTPSKLAQEIVTYTLSLFPSEAKIRYLEPGFGTGSFYSALLQSVPMHRIETAVGYEIDPHYARPAMEIWAETGLQLHIGDFTKAIPPQVEKEKFNLVICNPPYIRHHHLKQAHKRELQASVERYLHLRMNGLSGLYVYFLILSKAWMSNNGIGIWLVPSEFMDVNYGQEVKQFLVEQVTLRRIHRFDPQDVQFDDALVSSAVVVFQNTPPSTDHKIEFSLGGKITEPRLSKNIKSGTLVKNSKWTALPTNSPQASEKSAGTLGDLFTIKRGLVTGYNKFFILRPEQISKWRLPNEFLVPILPSPRYLETNEIFADERGNPKIKNILYLLDCNLPEDIVRAKYPSLWNYLQYGIETGVHERYLCRHRSPWYAQEKRPPALFLCTYMGRVTQENSNPFRFILNHSKATAPNVYLMLYPKQVLLSAIKDNPDAVKAVWDALSSISNEMLIREGRVYGGGLHKLEPKELANVPSDLMLEAFPNKKILKIYRQLRLFS